MLQLYHFFEAIPNRIIAASKNPAAYITSLSAVKKIQKAKKGIDKIKQTNEAPTRSRGFLIKTNAISNTKNNISCGFINKLFLNS
jgi:hypothetical protein